MKKAKATIAIMLILMVTLLMATFLFAEQKVLIKEEIVKLKEFEVFRSSYENTQSLKFPTMKNPFQLNVSSSHPKPDYVKSQIPSHSRDEIEIFIDGEESTTMTQGDDFVITVYFSDGSSDAIIQNWIDMNGNGTWEEDVDFNIEDETEIADNDIDDEDPTDGVYQFTVYAEDDGPNNVGNIGLLLVAIDSGGTDVAYLFIEALISDYSVSGDITPAIANLIVGVIPVDEDVPWMVMTDDTGHYQNYVPEVGTYIVMTFDPLGLTGGMFPDIVYFDVYIDGHLTGYDFEYIAPTSFFEGTVLDENDDPLAYTEIRANPEEGGMQVWTETDEDGNYTLGVMEGFWDVSLNNDEIIPDYLVPHEVELFVAEGETETVDFIAFTTDATITGTVYLDDIPVSGVQISCWSPLGWTETESELDGNYTLFVASEADQLEGYHIEIWDLPLGTYVDEQYHNINSGSTNIDFHLHTATGGIEGYLYDSATEEPLNEGWISATQDFEIWFNTGVWEDGYFNLPLPNGTYFIYANSDDYYQEEISDVVVQDEFVYLEFYLDPVSFDGALWGYVYEEGTEIPIEDAEVWANTEGYWNNAFTDESGFYYIDLPNGNYWVDVWREGYFGYHLEEIVINNDEIQQDFYLTPMIFNGSLSGYVYEEGTSDPIEEVDIWVSSDIFWTGTFTDPDGFYEVDLINGIYWLDAWKEGYEPFHIEGIEINDDDVIQNIFLTPLNSVDDNEGLSIQNELHQNSPNPFREYTSISFVLKEKDDVRIDIYNVKGQLVRTLIDEEKDKGFYNLIWNGKDSNDHSVSSGIYLYKMKTGKFADLKKMIVLQ
ncbi:MAG TPA: T9SS type A sorting domain-containing protein [Candidatus Cloacimonetes bacterium]|nr:T9SS type A sorting domain-containing protein [Candidatus Cloacimonadota bacterium]